MSYESTMKCPFDHGELELFPFSRAADRPLLPPPQLALARTLGPLSKVKIWDGRAVWIVTRMEEFRELMSSSHFSANPETPGFPAASAARAAQSKSYKTFITMDPPEHGIYRRMLTREFMVKRMEALRPFVQQTLNDLLDEMEKAGAPADFIGSVALPLPSLVISIMLGVPYEDHAKLQEWSANRMNLALGAEQVADSARNMESYIDNLLREKERNPEGSEDLLSRLAAEWINTGKLTHEHAVQIGALLYLAGHETTANQIGLGLLSLLVDSEQQRVLREDPSQVRGAIEEMLRFHSITHVNSMRVATADVTIGGQLIKKGEGVLALVQAANHDPEIFPDPERFDIRRDTKMNSHVAFSYGIHQCLGQPLARLEMDVVFRTIFKRFPTLSLAVPFEELKFKQSSNVFGLESLPVTW